MPIPDDDGHVVGALQRQDIDGARGRASLCEWRADDDSIVHNAFFRGYYQIVKKY